ncbi:hypothetical protein FE257_011370 [Aspergillus nanangensis]|uniref:feruloyl esterase n=1 Tax=Aspergillus nanangensis TaxID=2582783 RepID=A0AAD4GRE8_ASPNN|nr:hypothetical protein FE257_011370 [Aspergillus nanangensis]
MALWNLRYTSLLLVGILLALTAAAPTQLTSRDVSSDVLTQLNFFAEYSAAAYCTGNVNSTGNKVTCSAGNCPNVQAADTQTLKEFFADNQYGELAGYIAVDNTNKLIVLSFRGSRTPANWIANLDFGFEDASALCDGCEVHGGFWKAWKVVADALTTEIANALSTYPDYTLVFTGHSLGAAIATLAATELQTTEGYSIELYSYGGPRVGNVELAEYITSLGDNYRVTHTDDIVPRLPPHIAGFRHSSPEYWITSANEEPVTTADVQVIEGVGSTDGNAGEASPSTSAHAWYFFEIAKCQ